MKKLLFFLVILFVALLGVTDAQTVVYASLGDSEKSDDGLFTITLVSKKQYYDPSDTLTLDRDIRSPKSVNVHPDGSKYYVNSLEGARTVVYEVGTNKKLKVINHKFNNANATLWSKPSGLFEFTHYTTSLNSFYGKPVESTFSHEGRYLWVPYYRRSYDINAQDPSAVAVIDTEVDSIIRLMETGPLPKMIAVSPDNRYVAITHWGDNTVGLIDISGESPSEWHYVSCVEVGKKLTLDFDLETPVNRDVNSGLCLRGTAFTPDSQYLLVGCMGGRGGVAVIDVACFTYLGTVYGMKSNLRHLVIRNDYLYLSINKSGYVQRASLDGFLDAVSSMKSRKARYTEWENCKVGAGARTIDITPDGRYIVAACNLGSCLDVIDALTMKKVVTIHTDPYPVGLVISKDGNYVYTTSQGRSKEGGNCLDIFKIEY